ncbi:MAG TPA: hypothetical protein VFQ14_03005, partial [Thermoleophilaceae bacterium]|nr:hypothetical protein [Thermoleophilaceae bacterium]
YLDTVAGERYHGDQVATLRLQLNEIAQSVDLLDAVSAPVNGDVTVEVNADVLAHALESTARAVCGPRLTDRLGVGPFDSELTAEIVLLTDAIEWAAEQADRFHGIAADERWTAPSTPTGSMED